MKRLFRDFRIVNEGRCFKGSVLTDGDSIAEVLDADGMSGYDGAVEALMKTCGEVLDGGAADEGSGMLLMPGVIDDQVHFREPGATAKGSIATESRAAVLGGTPSFMDMPNNNPPVCSIEALEEKYRIAAEDSAANYSFYLGANNSNFQEIEKTDPSAVCGIKVFMGSSTGNMLVDSEEALGRIFSCRDMLIATHCEDEATVRRNMELAKERWGDNVPFSSHPLIRSREACILSTAKALKSAVANNTRLHILHVSTKDEIEMILKARELNPKITFEVCVHYMWFDSNDYDKYGPFVKCNPAIKTPEDRQAIADAVKNGLVNAVATDHAPHLISEKQQDYLHAPSGLPTVQHSLLMMLELSERGCFPLHAVTESMSHATAKTFGIRDRGYIRKGYAADLVTVSRTPFTVSAENIAYKCGWSPLEGHTFPYSVSDTFVNGTKVVAGGKLTGMTDSRRLTFNR